MNNLSTYAIRALGLCLFTMYGCAATTNGIVGNGNIQTEERSTAVFDTIVNDSNLTVEVNVIAGTAASTSVTCDSNVLEHIETRIAGQTLFVTQAPGPGFSTSGGCLVSTSIPVLAEANLESNGNIIVSGSVVDPLTLVSNGNGNLITSMAQATDVAVDLTANGNITVQASGNVTGSLSGNGNLRVTGGAVVSVEDTGNGSVIEE